MVTGDTRNPQKIEIDIKEREKIMNLEDTMVINTYIEHAKKNTYTRPSMLVDIPFLGSSRSPCVRHSIN